MRVVVDTLVPAKSGLIAGATIHFGEGGPVRFVQVELPIALFSWEVLDVIYNQVNAALDTAPPEDPLF